MKKVKIYIDRKEHECHERIEGEALYLLGQINSVTHDLWREEQGKTDDELIENTKTEIHLKEWTHFYSAEKTQKKITIIVNGTPHEVEKGEITYDEVVTLAFPDFPQHPERTYSVTYEKGQATKPVGILSPGGTVKVKDGMSFKVKHTGQS